METTIIEATAQECNKPDKVEKETHEECNTKRTDIIEEDDYFMGVAFLAAQRSKDPSTQVGACIVNAEKKIVGTGYNGMPNGCSDDDWPWAQTAVNPLKRKYPFVCHAVMNAIVYRNCHDVKGCTIYCTLFPSNESAKLIAQSGIKTVIYWSNKYEDEKDTRGSKELLKRARVTCRPLESDLLDITINMKVVGKKEQVVLNPKNTSQQRQTEASTSKQADDTDMNKKREDYMSWEEYYMANALLVAKRSEDPVTQVGACIVADYTENDSQEPDKRIVAMGYNRMPETCSEEISWETPDKHTYVCHAELNAIFNKNSYDVRNCTMYVTLFPCKECAKLIVQSGIKRIVYFDEKDSIDVVYTAAPIIFDKTGVKYKKYSYSDKPFVIKFE